MCFYVITDALSVECNGVFFFAQTAFITPSAHILTAALGFNCKSADFRVLLCRFTYSREYSVCFWCEAGENFMKGRGAVMNSVCGIFLLLTFFF